MTPSDPAPRWGIALALLAVYLIWGSTYYAIRVAIDTLPPFLMAGGRFVAAGVVLYGFARWRGAEPPAIRFWPRAGLVGGLMLLGGNGGVCWAETRVPSGLASLIIGSVPLWTVLLDWLRPGGRRPSAAVAAGVVAGFAGIAWLVRPGGTGAVDPLGAAVLVLAAASWAAGSVSSRQLDLPRSPLLATAMEMVTGGALLLVLGAATGECGRLDPAAVTPASAAAVLYLVVFGSLVGFSAFIWLLRVTTPAIATTYAYVNPLVALALGWAFLGESIPPRVAAGAAVILGAVALISRSAPPAGNPAGQPASTSSGPSSG